MTKNTRLDHEASIAALRSRNGPFSGAARQLLSQGYSPLPLVGKRPVEVGWQRRAGSPMCLEEIASWAARGDYNVGIATGHRGLIAIDIDTDDPEIRAALDALLHAAFLRGGVQVGKRGQRGETQFFRDASGLIGNRNFAGADGAMIIEILAAGRQTAVPPSVHPETAQSIRVDRRAYLARYRTGRAPYPLASGRRGDPTCHSAVAQMPSAGAVESLVASSRYWPGPYRTGSAAPVCNCCSWARGQ